MNEAPFHSAGLLDIEMFINRFRIQRFVFTANSVAFDITSFTWQLVFTENPGAKKSIISLTLGNGLSFPIYDENVIEARFSANVTNIREGQYYWQLIRTDTNEPWLNGWADFSYGPLSSGAEQEVTVNLVNNTIEVQLQSIVYVNTEGDFNTRSISTTSTATLTPNVDLYDLFVISAQSTALVIANPTGTAVLGNGFMIDIDDNGSAQAITYGNLYTSTFVTLPTTTIAGKRMKLVFQYNGTNWELLNVINEQ